MFVYLIYKHNSFNKLDQLGLSLHDLIVAKIHIFNKSLSLVHQAISIGLILLVFSLNLIVDNDQGNYKVNNIWLYIGFLVIAYLISVLMLHLSHNLYLKQYRTALDDLNTSKLTKMDAELRKYKWIRLFFLTIIFLGVIAGIIILFFKISGN